MADGQLRGSREARKPTTRWIKNPAWDLVWVLNALWLAPLVLLLAWGHDDVRASPVDGLFFAFAVPLWFGHRVSSAWLAYATPAYRPPAHDAAATLRRGPADHRRGLLHPASDARERAADTGD